ncbi:hypothetical protein [Streptomyces lacrimifluminis]|uniref:hypothetical protein n=1 Tax=Streptomyces lacrimifluminis TaxID=1500077 RepID=UPI001668AA5C|nr:hypothetical protein [Streptomyces lacrimifluminis]
MRAVHLFLWGTDGTRMADARADRAVFHRGRLVCRTRHERVFPAGLPGAHGAG